MKCNTLIAIQMETNITFYHVDANITFSKQKTAHSLISSNTNPEHPVKAFCFMLAIRQLR